MHDKPSDKPPSTFLRVFSSAKANETCTTLDELMEDYHNQPNESAVPPPASTRSSSRATQMAGLTHHANGSLSSSVTLAASTQSRDSGLHRLSRAVASMNPVSLWQKLASGRREPKDGAGRPGVDDDELVERQIRAEQAYAQYKAAGKLAVLGSRASSADLNVSAAGYTQPPSDSGIEMSDDLRSSMDTPSILSSVSQQQPQRISAPPGRASARKKFHIRTPSLQDLKRIASDASSVIMTASPTKPRVQEMDTADEGEEVPALLRSVRSRRDLARQTKLTKKVSNLEVKLETARRELQEALLLEKKAAATPRAASASSVSSRPGSRSTALHHHRFTAPLPSLPSESLLMGDDGDDHHNSYDHRRPAAGGRSLADIPDLPPPSHRRQESSTFAPEADADMMHTLISEMPVAPLEPPPPISVFESWSTDDEKKAPEAARRRAFRKRRHSARPASPGKPQTASEGGIRHKRNGSGDADAGAGASPRHKKLRTPATRREREKGGDDGAQDALPVPSPPRPRSAQAPLILGPGEVALPPPPPPEPLLPPPPPPLSPPLPQAPRAAAGLETVLEELNPQQHQNQQSPPRRALKPILRPSPSVPASLALAASGAGLARTRNVLHKHSRSMSPVKSPRREQQPPGIAPADSLPTAADLAKRHYRSRSVSPPPAPAPQSPQRAARATPEGAERRRLRRRREEAVRVWPDGVEVPPLPGRGVEQQQGTFEWPDDVF
jgi:hypothetical protein